MASTLPTCDSLFVIAGDKRNPNLQVVIAHVSHVCSEHSFGLRLRLNGMHITEFDHTLFGPSIARNLITRVSDYLSCETYAKPASMEKKSFIDARFP